jgi:glucose-1-phosphate adenylyltransferase
MLDKGWYPQFDIEDDRELFLASMGIYIFNRKALIELLDTPHTDFGKHIIPGAIKTHRAFSYVFQGYWEDVGTIRTFFEANLDAVKELPRFNFFDMTSPIFSRPRFLPSSKVNGATIDHALISDGCIINHARIEESIIGLRSIVAEGSHLQRVVAMGCDYYETNESIIASDKAGRPRIGIGRNTHIDNAIIDKNARIGDNVVITPKGKPDNVDHPLYYIRDGIVVVPRGGAIPHGTVI